MVVVTVGGATFFAAGILAVSEGAVVATADAVVAAAGAAVNYIYTVYALMLCEDGSTLSSCKTQLVIRETHSGTTGAVVAATGAAVAAAGAVVATAEESEESPEHPVINARLQAIAIITNTR